MCWIGDLFKTKKETVMPLPGADYWDNKWPKKDVTYRARGRYSMDVRNLILNKSCILDRVAEQYRDKGNHDQQALALLKYTISILTYKTDDELYNMPEYWQHPDITMAMRNGDCFAGYEEIHTISGLKKIEDIVEGDTVLSYDFDNKEHTYKKVTKVWPKGKLEVNRVHLRNGQHIDLSKDHPMWSRTNQQGESEYIKTNLSDIDLTRWWKRKIPISKKIPYTIVDIDWLNNDMLFIIGHYLAEGWFAKSGKVGSSGYDLLDTFIPLLEKNDIPFTEGTNNTGCPVVNFLASKFKEYLKTLKTDSFNIHLPEELFHLPQDKLQSLLGGFYLGDGHNGNYPDKRGFNSNKHEVYSTSSEQFASDIQRIGLHIGKTFHIWKQEHHGGAGNKPIYRVTFNPESHFLKDHGHENLSEVSISYIEKLADTKMYDLTVEDTHTVVLKNGVVTHQCEDGALFLASLMRITGIPAFRVKLCAGWVKSKKVREGHAYVIYLADDGKWYTLDWCYWASASLRNFKKKTHNDNPNYQEIWWTANDQFAWAQKDTTI